MTFFKNIKAKIQNSFRNNLSLVIYSVIIAIIAWFAISMSLYPSTKTTISHIPVIIDLTGTDAADSELSVISCNVDFVEVNISGSRMEIGNLSNDNLQAKLVADKVTSAGTKKLSFEITCTDPDIDFVVESVYPKTATVVFDRYDTREFPITPETPNISFGEGQTIDVDDYVCEPNTISITGPAAQLDKISKVSAVSNKEMTLDSSYTVSSDEIKLYTEDGAAIDQEPFKFYNSNFIINIPVLTQKTVDLSVGISGAPSSFKSEFLQFNLSADSITLASKTSNIADFPNPFEVGKILLSDLDIGYTKTFIIDTGNYKNMSNLESVTVTLNDENLARKEITIRDFNLTNAPDNYDFDIVTQNLTVAVVGPKDVIDDITSGDIVADINLLNLDSNSENEMFNWDVTISFPKYNNVWAVTTSKAIVRKTAKVTSPTDDVSGNSETN